MEFFVEQYVARSADTFSLCVNGPTNCTISTAAVQQFALNMLNQFELERQGILQSSQCIHGGLNCPIASRVTACKSDAAVLLAMYVVVAVLGTALAACASFAAYQWVKGGSSIWRTALPPGASGGTTLLVTDIQNSTQLWEQLPPRVMDASIRVHHCVIRGSLSMFRGYESATEGDAFIIAFHSAQEAAHFACHVQVALQAAQWPQELLEHEQGCELWTECLANAQHPLSAAARCSMPHAIPLVTHAEDDVLDTTSLQLSPEFTTSPQGNSQAGNLAQGPPHSRLELLPHWMGTSPTSSRKMLPFPNAEHTRASNVMPYDAYLACTDDRSAVGLADGKGPMLFESLGARGAQYTPSHGTSRISMPGADHLGALHGLHADSVNAHRSSLDVGAPGGRTWRLCHDGATNGGYHGARAAPASAGLGMLAGAGSNPASVAAAGTASSKACMSSMAVDVVHACLDPNRYARTGGGASLGARARARARLLLAAHTKFRKGQQASQPGAGSQPQGIHTSVPPRIGAACNPGAPPPAQDIANINSSQGMLPLLLNSVQGSDDVLSSWAMDGLAETGFDGPQSTQLALLGQGIPSRPTSMEGSGQIGTSALTLGEALAMVMRATSGHCNTPTPPGGSDGLLTGGSDRVKGGFFGQLIPSSHGLPSSGCALATGSAGQLGSARGSGRLVGCAIPNTTATATAAATAAAAGSCANAGRKRMVLAFRGLRVRIGLHSGVTHPRGLPKHSQSVGRVQYGGEVLLLAKQVCDGGAGGMVLLTQASLSQLQLHVLSMQCFMLHMGSHILAGSVGSSTPSSMSLPSVVELLNDATPMVQMLPHSLAGRIPFFTGSMRTKRQVGLDVFSAPTGVVTIAFMNVAGASVLLAWNKQVAQAALRTYEGLVSAALLKAGGYPVEIAGGLCLAAFADPASALAWSLAVKASLPAAAWSEEVLEHELFEEVAIMVPSRQLSFPSLPASATSPWHVSPADAARLPYKQQRGKYQSPFSGSSHVLDDPLSAHHPVTGRRSLGLPLHAAPGRQLLKQADAESAPGRQGSSRLSIKCAASLPGDMLLQAQQQQQEGQRPASVAGVPAAGVSAAGISGGDSFDRGAHTHLEEANPAAVATGHEQAPRGGARAVAEGILHGDDVSQVRLEIRHLQPPAASEVDGLQSQQSQQQMMMMSSGSDQVSATLCPAGKARPANLSRAISGSRLETGSLGLNAFSQAHEESGCDMHAEALEMVGPGPESAHTLAVHADMPSMQMHAEGQQGHLACASGERGGRIDQTSVSSSHGGNYDALNLSHASGIHLMHSTDDGSSIHSATWAHTAMLGPPALTFAGAELLTTDSAEDAALGAGSSLAGMVPAAARQARALSQGVGMAAGSNSVHCSQPVLSMDALASAAAHEQYAEEHLERQVLVRGPRIKVGIDLGFVIDRASPANGIITYRGRVMNRAARIAFQATQNQILCSAAVWKAHGPAAAAAAEVARVGARAGLLDADTPVHAASIGAHMLKGIPGKIELYTVSIASQTVSAAAAVASVGCRPVVGPSFGTHTFPGTANQGGLSFAPPTQASASGAAAAAAARAGAVMPAGPVGHSPLGGASRLSLQIDAPGALGAGSWRLPPCHTGSHSGSHELASSAGVCAGSTPAAMTGVATAVVPPGPTLATLAVGSGHTAAAPHKPGLPAQSTSKNDVLTREWVGSGTGGGGGGGGGSSRPSLAPGGAAAMFLAAVGEKASPRAV